MPSASSELFRAAEALLPTMDAWGCEYWHVHRQRLADDLAIVDRFSGRILEVGSAPFLTTMALSLAGRDVVGIDIDPQSSPLGLTVLGCDIEREPLPVADDSFDVVLFSEVFEHLRIDPLFTMEELRRVLRPGGNLLLTTPNLRSLRGLLRLSLLGKGWAVGADPATEYTKLRQQGWMGHVREYTAKEVGGVLRCVGFDVKSTIWRRKPGALWQIAAERVIPAARPYMTLIAR